MRPIQRLLLLLLMATLAVSRPVLANSPPTLSPIADQTINENTSTGPIHFTVSDPETSASALIVAGNSSNPTLVPAGHLVFAGSGTNRTVTVIPAANQFGTATITVTANDGAGSTGGSSFTVTVNPVIGAPETANSASGLYQITAGSYSECCGIGGNDFGFDLPNERQMFVRFTADAQRHLATMTFLAEDGRTVFSTVPCPFFSPINFSFSSGLIFSNYTVFHVDPGGPPYQLYWNYTVSNSPNRLRIDGIVGAVRPPCSDVPTRFSHSNVMAVLIPGPRLSILDSSKHGAARIMVQGNAGWTDVIEASADLATWAPVSTNFMDFSLCPICPFAIFEDKASTNLARRFYRSFEFR